MKTSYKILLSLLCVVVFVFLAVGTSGDDEEPAAEPEEEIPSLNWATAELTEANIRKVLSREFNIDPIYDDGDFPEDITSVTVEENNIIIEFKPETMWDETDFVKRVGGTTIIVGSVLFDNPDVVWVKVVAITEMTDQYGNTEDEEGAFISLDRELADKVDWEGLADRHSSDPGNIYRLSAEYYIHPGIRKNVKMDEVEIN
jgi:hypothetical protein